MFDKHADIAWAMAQAVVNTEEVDRAQVSGAQAVISLVIALTVGAIVAAFLLPIGVDELVAANVSAWSTGAQSLWNILDVIIVLALFLFFIAVALAAANKV